MARTRSAKHPSDGSSEHFLGFLATNKKRFDTRLRRKLRAELRRFPRVGPTIKLTAGALVELCERGGKRVRPGLLLAGSLCVTDEPDVDVIADAGAALELLHGYFLVHDDWMDGDLVRRNGPSVHATLRTKLGDDALGDAAAIMAGDWGVAVATDWMARLAVKPQLLSRALQCFTAMQLAAVTGQIRDLLATDDRPEITYELKTASYTVSGPLRLGAILGGAKDSTLSDLERFALPIGVAFQLRDDLIGVFSPEAVTGKPFASDIKQGKRTVLALEGRRRADGAMLKRWNRVFGNATSSRRDLESVVEFLEHCGAKDAVERRISKLYSESLAALDGARLKPRGKELLRSAAAALIVRGS